MLYFKQKKRKDADYMTLRKINRGLVLGAVVIAATAAYVVYENAQFSKYKPDIEKTVDAYLTDLCKANVDASAEDSKEPFEEIINRYWAGGGSSNAFSYNNSTKTDALSNLKFDADGYGSIESMDYHTEKIDIAKYGPDCAIVTLQYSTNSVYYGDPAYFDGYYNTFSSTDYSEGERPAADLKQQMTILYVDSSFIMRLEDGEWKIINSFSGSWYSEGATVLHDENSDTPPADDSETDNSYTPPADDSVTENSEVPEPEQPDGKEAQSDGE